MPEIQTRVITSHVPVEFLALENQRHRLTLEALEQIDVNGGVGIAHDEVEAWIDSLGSSSPTPMPTC
jgi:hypothetical protein